MENNNTLFAEQFSKLNKEFSPIFSNFVEKEDIGDNVILFYLAGIIKEFFKENDDKQLKESVLTFMFDE